MRLCTQIFLFCVAFVLPAFGDTYSWNVTNQVFPNQIDPAMALFNSTTTNPVLSSTDLLLQTPNVQPEPFMGYIQSATNLAIPTTNLVISFEMKLESGASTAAGRAPVHVAFVTATNVEGVLGIDHGVVFLSFNINSRQASASVATDDTFHFYTIVVDNPSLVGSPVRVYYDGSQILSGSLLGPGDNSGSQPEIWFGHGTAYAYGSSRWKSFSHNAEAHVTNNPTTSIATAVEIYWQTASNQNYQVQWTPALNGSNIWTNLGTNVIGDGSQKSVFDSTRNQPQKFYRIITLP